MFISSPIFLQLLPKGHFQIAWSADQERQQLQDHRTAHICILEKQLPVGLASNQPETKC